MNNNSYHKGLAGEMLALKYLQNKGFKHIASRFKTIYGEIDLIMQDGDTLVFVEVKYRSGSHAGDGLMAIDMHKQERILLAAEQYLYENNIDSPIRIDALEITSEGYYYVPNAINR